MVYSHHVHARWWIWPLALILTTCIFLFDIVVELGVASSVPYAGVLLLGLWIPREKCVWALGFLAIALTVIGYFLSPPGGEEWKTLLNRAIALAAIVTVGCLVIMRRRTEARLRNAASHDTLTGLFNRRYLMEAIGFRITTPRLNRRNFALLYFDLNHFKSINDRFGHLTGDSVLTAFANALVQTVPEETVVARIGGDEFVVLTDSARSRNDAERLAEDIRDVVNRRLAELDLVEGLCVSVGIAMYPEEGASGPSLLNLADRHMYQNKRESHSDLIRLNEL